jgi:hypothetical protein
MPKVTQENIEFIQLSQRYTDEISVTLAISKRIQQFEPIIMWEGKSLFPIKMGLILILNHSFAGEPPKQTVYSKEAHIIGKAIRLLVYLEEVERLFELLEPYVVGTIAITTETDPHKMTSINRWQFEVEFAKKIVCRLISLKSQSQALFDKAMASIVDEKSWPKL